MYPYFAEPYIYYVVILESFRLFNVFILIFVHDGILHPITPSHAKYDRGEKNYLVYSDVQPSPTLHFALDWNGAIYVNLTLSLNLTLKAKPPFNL